MLGWNPETDAPIRVWEQVPPKVSDALRELQIISTEYPNISLVCIDTMMKFLKVGDLNDFAEVQFSVRQLRDIAVSRGIHVLASTHSKKGTTDNVFDGLLGSTAIRAETDCTLALFEVGGQRVIAAEVRRGRQMQPTVIQANMVLSDTGDRAELVAGFFLQGSLDAWKEAQSAKSEKRAKESLAARIVAFPQHRDDLSAPHQTVLEEVTGSTAGLSEAIGSLERQGIVTFSGVKRSPANLLRVTLNHEAVERWQGQVNTGGSGLQALQQTLEENR